MESLLGFLRRIRFTSPPQPELPPLASRTPAPARPAVSTRDTKGDTQPIPTLPPRKPLSLDEFPRSAPAVFEPPESDSFLRKAWEAAKAALPALTEEVVFMLEHGNYAQAKPGPTAVRVHEILNNMTGGNAEGYANALMFLENMVDVAGGATSQKKGGGNALVLTLTPASALAPAA